MAERVVTHLILLHESELRVAAAALDRVLVAQDKESDEFPALCVEAINACIAALHGITKDPDAALILTATDNLIRKPGRKKR